MKKVLLATIGLLSLASTLSAYHGGFYQGAYLPGGYWGNSYPAQQDYYYYQSPDQPSDMYYQGPQNYPQNSYMPDQGMYNQTPRMYFRNADYSQSSTTTQTQPSWGWGSNMKTAVYDRIGDDKIAQKIRLSLKNDLTFSDSARNIQINVTNGKVTLTGVVGSNSEKTKIETMVKEASGVNSVVNNLKVSSTPVTRY